jgi:hypothetical protein
VREFAARVHATELGLEEAVRLGLYVDEDKRTVELRFNAESADDRRGRIGGLRRTVATRGGDPRCPRAARRAR